MAATSARRLAIVIHSLGAGGAERVSVNLANALAVSGWHVTLVTFETQDADFYHVDAGVARVALDLSGASRNALSAVFANARRLAAVRRTLRHGAFDTVLGMTSEVAVVTILAAAGLGMRVVVSERIHPPALRIGAVWHCLRRQVYRFADQVVVLAEQSRQWIETHAPGSRTRIIPNPVVLPLPDSAPRVEPADFVATADRLLLAVGRLAPQKGFDRLLEAFHRIARRFPDWKLVIVGEGAERPNLEAQVARLGLEGSVALPGHAGNLSAWYARADLFVLSSRFEGFPNVLAEAMAHGCPAVATDCPTGPRDIVRDGLDGLLVRRIDDPQALADALASLMADPPLRATMASRAADVAQRFGPDEIMALWRDALERPAGR